MEFAEYRIMYEAEDTHWWYRGLRGAITALVRLPSSSRPRIRILDAGCGTGGNLHYLQERGFQQLSGFDYSEHALHFCHLRGLRNVVQGSATDIPFPDNSFDLIISCDMLNDAGISSEQAALQELYRILRPGGKLFLNLPALNILAGEHDRATSVARRYTRRSVSRLLIDAGFELHRVTYRNMFLLPVIFAVRMLRRDNSDKSGARSDIALPPRPMNALLSAVMSVEQFLLRYVDLPVGSSVSVVVRRPLGRTYEA